MGITIRSKHREEMMRYDIPGGELEVNGFGFNIVAPQEALYVL